MKFEKHIKLNRRDVNNNNNNNSSLKEIERERERDTNESGKSTVLYGGADGGVEHCSALVRRRWMWRPQITLKFHPRAACSKE